MIRTAIDRALSRVWTALPVRVLQDSDGHTTELQPTVKAIQTFPDGSQQFVEMPQLGMAPVHYPSGGGWTITHPIKQGDEGIAVFSARNLDGWYDKGGVQQPIYPRRHNLSDAMYVPGVRSVPRQLGSNGTTAPSTNSLQIRTDDGQHYYELTSDTANVKANNTNVNAQQAFTVNAQTSTVNAQTSATVNTATSTVNATSQHNINTPQTNISSNLKALGFIDAAGGFFQNGVPIGGGTGGGGGTGTVTSITAGAGLTGGTITAAGTIALAIPVTIADGGTNATTAAAAVTNLGAAPLASPVFTGNPTAPTPATADSSVSLATTAFVKAQSYLVGNQAITLSGDVTGSGATAITTTLANSGVAAGTYNNVTVNIKGLATAGSNIAYLTANQPITLSGDVTGGPQATAIPTTLATVNSNIGTFQGLTIDGKGRVTAAVNQNYAPLASPALTGTPTAPTVAPADNSTLLATTAFVKAQGYQSGNQAITLSGDVTGSGATAITTTLASSGVAAGTYNNLTVNAKGLVTAGSNIAYVTGGPYLPLAGGTVSPGPLILSAAGPAVLEFTNTALTPITGGLWRAQVGTAGNLSIQQNTAAAGDFSTFTQLQLHEASGSLLLGQPTPTDTGAGSINCTGGVYVNGAALAPLASPVFTGNPTAPTPATADSSVSVATTAFVKAQNYAPLASPVFTGNPQLTTTPATADNSTAIADTAFVKAVGAGKAAFNNITVANPAGTTSTTFVMMGLGYTITPVFAGTVAVAISGFIQNSIAGVNAVTHILYGTGTPPVNGAAITGTQLTRNTGINSTGYAAAQNVPFAQSAVITGLTPGTAYWIDLALQTGTGGTATVVQIGGAAFEV